MREVMREGNEEALEAKKIVIGDLMDIQGTFSDTLSRALRTGIRHKMDKWDIDMTAAYIVNGNERWFRAESEK